MDKENSSSVDLDLKTIDESSSSNSSNVGIIQEHLSNNDKDDIVESENTVDDEDEEISVESPTVDEDENRSDIGDVMENQLAETPEAEKVDVPEKVEDDVAVAETGKEEMYDEEAQVDTNQVNVEENQKEDDLCNNNIQEVNNGDDEKGDDNRNDDEDDDGNDDEDDGNDDKDDDDGNDDKDDDDGKDNKDDDGNDRNVDENAKEEKHIIDENPINADINKEKEQDQSWGADEEDDNGDEGEETDEEEEEESKESGDDEYTDAEDERYSEEEHGKEKPTRIEASEEEEEEPRVDKKSNEIEDKKNPAYVPRKGAFFEHDMRADSGNDGKDETADKEKSKRKSRADDNKWKHDKFDAFKQAPKKTYEIVRSYGYDIRRDGQGHNRKLERREPDIQKELEIEEEKRPVDAVTRSPRRSNENYRFNHNRSGQSGDYERPRRQRPYRENRDFGRNYNRGNNGPFTRREIITTRGGANEEVNRDSRRSNDRIENEDDLLENIENRRREEGEERNDRKESLSRPVSKRYDSQPQRPRDDIDRRRDYRPAPRRGERGFKSYHWDREDQGRSYYKDREDQGRSYHKDREDQGRSYHKDREDQGRSYHKDREDQGRSYHKDREDQGRSYRKDREDQGRSYHKDREDQGRSYHKDREDQGRSYQKDREDQGWSFYRNNTQRIPPRLARQYDDRPPRELEIVNSNKAQKVKPQVATTHEPEKKLIEMSDTVDKAKSEDNNDTTIPTTTTSLSSTKSNTVQSTNSETRKGWAGGEFTPSWKIHQQQQQHQKKNPTNEKEEEGTSGVKSKRYSSSRQQQHIQKHPQYRDVDYYQQYPQYSGSTAPTPVYDGSHHTILPHQGLHTSYVPHASLPTNPYATYYSSLPGNVYPNPPVYQQPQPATPYTTTSYVHHLPNNQQIANIPQLPDTVFYSHQAQGRYFESTPTTLHQMRTNSAIPIVNPQDFNNQDQAQQPEQVIVPSQ